MNSNVVNVTQQWWKSLLGDDNKQKFPNFTITTNQLNAYHQAAFNRRLRASPIVNILDSIHTR